MAMESDVELSSSKHKASKRIMFVATTPFAVNSFLAAHLKSMSKYYVITLCVNLHSYALDPQLKNFVEVVDIGFERKISPFMDVVSLVRLFFAIRRVRPHCHSQYHPESRNSEHARRLLGACAKSMAHVLPARFGPLGGGFPGSFSKALTG